MKKKILLISAVAVFALAGCDTNTGSNTSGNVSVSSNVTTNNDKTNEENEKLKEENATLKQELEAIKASSDAATAKNAELEAENKKIKEELENCVDEIVDLKEQNDEIKRIKENYLKSNNSFEVSFINYLGESKTKIFNVNDYSTVLKALNEVANVNSSSSTYGTYISSIDNSFSDPNWGIMFYENYDAAATGIDGLEINAGDVFEFKHECWNTTKTENGTLDRYDVLVDKALYYYANNRLKNTYNEKNTYEGSTYWEDMALYKLINAEGQYGALYDQTLFSSNLLNDTLKTTISNKNIEELSGTDLFKFYYSARLTNYDFTSFKTKYSSYVESFTEYGEWDEYKIPFVTSSAKTLGLIDKLSDNVKNTTYKPDYSQWGPDGISWQLTGMASYKTLTDTELSTLSFDLLDKALSKDVSLSSMILPYAASNKNIRELKDKEGVDVIESLFNNYFDLTTMKFDTEASTSDYSSNQIYAALVAYKVQRDTNKACNLFE